MSNCNIEKEVWKDVKGWEGFYQVSNFGRVRSLDRVVKGKDGKEKNLKGKVMKDSYNKYNGYLSVRLAKNGKAKAHYNHRLVAISFLKKGEDKTEVNHKDEVKTNNHVTNLEWVSRLENNMYNGRSKKIANKTAKINKRNGHYEKLGKKLSKKIRSINLSNSEVKVYESVTLAARENGFDRSYLGKVANGEYKHAYGYKWEYI